jgi:HK97 gp10 family phage protein
VAQIDVEVSGLRELLQKLEGFPEWMREARRDALVAAGREMERTAAQLVPVRTGALKQSIYSRVVGEVLHFGAAKGYAGYVEYGTRPHEILPVRAKVLRFEVRGRAEAVVRRGRRITIYRGRGGRIAREVNVVFARRVMHPGTWGRPFIGPAVEMTKAVLPELMREKLRGWFRK